MNKIIKGRDLMLFIKVDGKYKSIAQSTNHTIDRSTSTVNVSTKDMGGGQWDTQDPDVKSWTCSSENLMCDDANGVTVADLKKLWRESTLITGIFGLEGNSEDLESKKSNDLPSEGYWTPKSSYKGEIGEMFITQLTENAPNGDNASFTVNFQGRGQLKEITEADIQTLKSNAGVKVATTAATSTKSE